MAIKRTKILILGVTGMLGHTLFSELASDFRYIVHGTSRSGERLADFFPPKLLEKITIGIVADNFDSVVRIIGKFNPDVVVNCIGIIKQLPSAEDPVTAIYGNALFPHRLAHLCRAAGARLIHISTDCVFAGDRGNYYEEDRSDAVDLYGRTKYLGEVAYKHCLTLRTSIIGHELQGHHGILEWFLSQSGTARGYTQAIFSGFPTIELARIISDYVLPRPELSGLCQVSSDPISKFDLLRIIADRYKKNIVLEPSEVPVIDRSLDSGRFRGKSGYAPPDWGTLVQVMYDNFTKSYCYRNRQTGGNNA